MTRTATLSSRLLSLIIAALLLGQAACGSGAGTTQQGVQRGALERGGKADATFELSLRITEVMATPADDRSGEYVEVYNDSPLQVSLEGLLLDDEDSVDTLIHRSGPTHLEAFGYGVIVDPDYRDPLPPEAAVYTVSDRALGNGLAASDPVILRAASGLVLERVGPRATLRGYARERRAPLLDDVSTSWRLTREGSPGRRNRHAPSERLKLHLTHDWDEAETVAALVDFIDATEQTLDCAIYQMNHPEVMRSLLAAHERGVAVRIVTDTTFFDERADYYAGYEALLAAGMDIVPDQRSSEMHDKFLVSDRRYVWLGSYNPTMNHSADSALELDSASLARELERQVDDMMAGKFGVWKRKTEQERHLVDGTELRLLTSPQGGVLEVILAELGKARRSIHFLAFGLTEDRVGDALLERAGAGVQVHGAIDWLHASRTGSEWSRLVEAGLDVRRSPHAMLMHQKLIVIDGGTPDAVVILGSYNFTNRAETRNDETMLVVRSGRLAAMAESAIAAVMRDSESVGQDAMPALAITEVAQGTTAWVEVENQGPEAIALVGFELTDLESVSRLTGVLAPGERRVVVFEGPLGGSSPVFLRDAAGRVIDAVATDDVIRSPQQTLRRLGPVSWELSSPTPGR
ncbi:MAG: phospholipase D-like domain-containing protein [Deltaproteobacteria bacterium]|nr:phospholipase D-like domain-containing protein [Deltaproteobacteria bacterium]